MKEHDLCLKARRDENSDAKGCPCEGACVCHTPWCPASTNTTDSGGYRCIFRKGHNGEHRADDGEGGTFAFTEKKK